MSDFHPRCPKCDKPMDRGHVPDLAHGGVAPSTWARGEPEPRKFVGGIKYRAADVIQMSAYRCPACGYVELYARLD